MSIGFNKSFVLSWLHPTIRFLAFFLYYENVYYLYKMGGPAANSRGDAKYINITMLVECQL